MACGNCGAEDGVKGVIRIVHDDTELKGRLIRRCRSCNWEESSEVVPREWVDILVDGAPSPFANAGG
jgi:hypothetical protein